MAKSLAAIAYVVAVLTCAVHAHAECSQYPKGREPRILVRSMEQQVYRICYSAYAIGYSGVAREALWSVEYLTPERISAARALPRTDSFHEETLLPWQVRSELRDYSRSGYDRGHLSPNGDMPDVTAQHESFSLANIVPQEPYNNRFTWESIEAAVRLMAKERPLYVYTGPLFLSENQAFTHTNRVAIPSHLYKLVYDPRADAAAAYLIENVKTKEYRFITVAELEKLSGLDFRLGDVSRLYLHKGIQRRESRNQLGEE